MVAVACFIPGRAKDLSAHARNILRYSMIGQQNRTMLVQHILISLHFACHHWLRITFVYSNKTRNVSVNVTLRCIPVMIVAVEKQ